MDSGFFCVQFHVCLLRKMFKFRGMMSASSSRSRCLSFLFVAVFSLLRDAPCRSRAVSSWENSSFSSIHCRNGLFCEQIFWQCMQPTRQLWAERLIQVGNGMLPFFSLW